MHCSDKKRSRGEQLEKADVYCRFFPHASPKTDRLVLVHGDRSFVEAHGTIPKCWTHACMEQ